MIHADHTLEDEFRTPDWVRAHVVERILSEGLAVVDDFQAQAKPSNILEDLLLDLPASTRAPQSSPGATRTSPWPSTPSEPTSSPPCGPGSSSWTPSGSILRSDRRPHPRVHQALHAAAEGHQTVPTLPSLPGCPRGAC